MAQDTSKRNNQGPRGPEGRTYTMKRIPPSRKMRQEVEEVLSGCETEGHPLDKFISLGARYMLQVAVEQEVEDYLGKAHYRQGSRQKEWLAQRL